MMARMTHLADVYRSSLALSTDLYELTMAQAYRHAGRAEEEAVFHLFFRRNPFGGGFAVACGLARALDYLAGFHFTAEDVAYLEASRATTADRSSTLPSCASSASSASAVTSTPCPRARSSSPTSPSSACGGRSSTRSS